MVKIDYDKLVEATNKIEKLRARSVDIASAITSLQQEVDPDGDIQLMIQKSQKCFCLKSAEIIPLLQAKKDAVDADIKKLLDKITIQP